MPVVDAPASPVVEGDAGAGKYLKKSERFVRDERLNGNLKSFRFGNRVMYHLADLDAYIERARREAEVASGRRKRRSKAVA